MNVAQVHVRLSMLLQAARVDRLKVVIVDSLGGNRFGENSQRLAHGREIYASTSSQILCCRPHCRSADDTVRRVREAHS